MKKLNITKGTIKNVFKVVGGVAVYCMATAKSNKTAKDIIDMVRYSRDVKYSDVMNVIMDSNMFDSNKNEAMALLKKNQDADYYRTFIRIVKSNMFDSNKIKAITNLNKDEEA